MLIIQIINNTNLISKINIEQIFERGNNLKPILYFTGKITHICPLPNENNIFFGLNTGEVYSFNLSDNNLEKRISGIGEISDIFCAPKWNIIGTIINNNGIKVWNYRTGELLKSLWYEGFHFVKGIFISPERIALGGNDRALLLLEFNKGKIVRYPEGLFLGISDLFTYNDHIYGISGHSILKWSRTGQLLNEQIWGLTDFLITSVNSFVPRIIGITSDYQLFYLDLYPYGESKFQTLLTLKKKPMLLASSDTDIFIIYNNKEIEKIGIRTCNVTSFRFPTQDLYTIGILDNELFLGSINGSVYRLTISQDL